MSFDDEKIRQQTQWADSVINMIGEAEKAKAEGYDLVYKTAVNTIYLKVSAVKEIDEKMNPEMQKLREWRKKEYVLLDRYYPPTFSGKRRVRDQLKYKEAVRNINALFCDKQLWIIQRAMDESKMLVRKREDGDDGSIV